MTAADKASLVNRLNAVTAAVASFPDSIPPIDSLYIWSGRVNIGLGYDYAKDWTVVRRLAHLANAVNATTSIARSGSRLRLAAEFRHQDINFAATYDLSAEQARALAKALGAKLPAVANLMPLVFAAADLFKAVKTLESA